MYSVQPSRVIPMTVKDMWTSQQIRRGDLVDNAPHYTKDPLVGEYYAPAGPTKHGPDDMVWILYHYKNTDWQEYFLKKGA